LTDRLSNMKEEYSVLESIDDVYGSSSVVWSVTLVLDGAVLICYCNIIVEKLDFEAVIVLVVVI